MLTQCRESMPLTTILAIDELIAALASGGEVILKQGLLDAYEAKIAQDGPTNTEKRPCAASAGHGESQS